MKRSRTELFTQSPPDENGWCTYEDPGRSATCLEGLEALWKDEILCDVVVSAGDRAFSCHRSVLAASSKYFMAMFQHQFMESNSGQVTLNQADPVSFSSILDYIYKGKIRLSSSTVQGVFVSAHMFQLSSLESICSNYMEVNINVQNSLEVYFFAVLYEQEQLQLAAKKVICENFVEITCSKEYLELKSTEAADILSFTMAKSTELDVYYSALRWLRHDLSSRQSQVHVIMKAVRFGLLDERIFRQNVKNNPLLKDCAELHNTFDQVLYLLNHPNRWNEVDLALEPRIGEVTCTVRCVVYTSLQQLQCYASDRQLQARLDAGPIRLASHPMPQYFNLPADSTHEPVLTTCGTNSLYIVGGNNGQKASRKLFEYVSAFSRPFISLGNMAYARIQFSVVQVDRFLYVIGGQHKGQNLDAVEKYDPEKEQWTRVAAMPLKLRLMTVTSMRGKMYVFGGESQEKRKGRKEHREISDKVLSYDPETDTWSFHQAMKVGRVMAGCAVFRNNIYVVGGVKTLTDEGTKPRSPESGLSTCEIYNSVTDSWSLGPPLPRQLYGMGVIKFEGTIYVLGGWHRPVPAEGAATTHPVPSMKVFHMDKSGFHWSEASCSLPHPAQKYASYVPLSFEFTHGRGRPQTSMLFTDSDSEESEASPWNSMTPHRNISQIHLDSSTDSDGSMQPEVWFGGAGIY